MKILRNVICVILALAMFVVTPISAYATLTKTDASVSEQANAAINLPETGMFVLEQVNASVTLPKTGWKVIAHLGPGSVPGVLGIVDRVRMFTGEGGGFTTDAYCRDSGKAVPPIETPCDYYHDRDRFSCTGGDWQELSPYGEVITPEPTPTPTNTPTSTPTETPTITPTSTPTETPTNTPTETATPTELPTDMPTLTATIVPTELPTPQPTNTPNPTEAPTEVVPTNTPKAVWTPFVIATSGGHTFRYGKIEAMVRTGKVDYVWMVLGSAAFLATFGLLIIKRKKKG